MKIVVYTQYSENYGDEANPFWKYKGGSEYIVARMTANAVGLLSQFGGMKAHVDELIAKFKIEYSNPKSSETVIGWSVEEDDFLTQDERDQLEYDGKITSPVKDFTKETVNV